MAASMIALGIGLGAIGVAGSIASKYGPRVITNLERKLTGLQPLNMSKGMKYYRGGFEKKMTVREASLILGVSSHTPEVKIRNAYRKIMLLNHPDRGGSPYLASKINEARDILGGKQK